MVKKSVMSRNTTGELCEGRSSSLWTLRPPSCSKKGRRPRITSRVTSSIAASSKRKRLSRLPGLRERRRSNGVLVAFLIPAAKLHDHFAVGDFGDGTADVQLVSREDHGAELGLEARDLPLAP